MKNKQVDKKVVVITGASSGIGLSTAQLFAKNGYKVYGLSRRLCQTDSFTSIACDVCDTGKVRKTFEEIYLAEGRIDVLINNAGMGKRCDRVSYRKRLRYRFLRKRQSGSDAQRACYTLFTSDER